jgi:peptide/nickel transport system substrate-binding protein
MHGWIMRWRRGASIAAAILAGCVGSPRPKDVVVFASGTDLESANPLVTIHPLARQVQRHVLFVTLTRYDSNLMAEPYYARRWTWSGDRRVLTFTLTPGLTWQDGVATTATDAAFTLLRARDARTGYPRAAELTVIDTAVASSDSTLVIRFRNAQRDVPRILSELPLVPAHALTSVAAPDMRRHAFSTQPIGNGPFRFVRRVAGQRWEFARNDNFPVAMGGPPHIRELVVAVVDEATTKFAGLAAGELDFAGIAASMADLARRDPMIVVMDYPVLFATGLVFNVHRPPFDDARVRRAVDLAINRRRIVTAALMGFGTPASGPVPAANPLALGDTAEFDPVRADALLDSAGWRRGANGGRAKGQPFDVELLTVGSGDNAIEQLIQADLAERGIRLRLRQMELGAFLTLARAPKKTFDVLITGVPGDLSLGYVSAMFESAQRGGSLDYSAFHSPRLDAMFAGTRSAATSAELTSAWRDTQRELRREMPVVWLYHARGLQGVSARMRNVTLDLRGELTSVSRWTVDTLAPNGTVARR